MILRPAPVSAAAALLALTSVPAAAGPGLDAIQKEFKTSLEKGTPATVSVVARDGVGGCSGVIVSRRGLVLSDFDAGILVKNAKDPPAWTDDVKVRVPDLATGAFVEYAGRIVKRLPDVDSTLIQILKPPQAGFRYLVPATAEDLHVGCFTFAAGNAFGMSSENLPTMTAGVVAAVTYLPRARADGAGRFEFLYTGAAVSPGVAGGPLLDVEGRLVGVISGYEPVTPDNPFQFLGRAVPMDRLRAAYASVPEAKDAFDEKAPRGLRADETGALETVIARAASDTYPSVASLVVEREKPLSAVTFGDKGPVDLPRYLGPASAIAISDDGWLLTSLYNLTNVAAALSVSLSQALPPAARISAGLDSIKKLTAVFPDGAKGEAKLVALHESLGVALLKADVAGRRAVPPAPPSAYAPGRFVVPVANPFGGTPRPDPLVNFGVVSKRHRDDIADPWRGQLQTDAGGTDGNCGAAAVDMEGRLLGVLTLWAPIHHGRNSGIGFVVPWDRIEPVLAAMKTGRSYRLPRLGLSWPTEPRSAPKVTGVQENGPVAQAGMLAGDVVLKFGDTPVSTVEDCAKALLGRFAGERLAILVDRGGNPVVLDVELGSRD